jgi:hypothetical protein
MSESGFEFDVGEGTSETDDILAHLAAEPCPWPECEGILRRDVYKDTDAVVCDDCAVPAARVWGDEA